MKLWNRKPRARNRRRDARPAMSLPAINWRRLTRLAATLAAVAVVFAGIRMAMDQPVERVDISGRFQRVQPLDVQKAVRDTLSDHGMMGVDLRAVSAAVGRLPWVDHASVARRWPRTLQVQVVEQVPVARWGEASLLNARGEVFVRDARHIPAELPVFAGPEGTQAQMTARYLAAQSRLADAGLRLSRLQLDERGSWEVDLDNGVRLRLGSSLVDERFERFILAAARIVMARATEISYVDMRYANGFAIGWRANAGEVRRG